MKRADMGLGFFFAGGVIGFIGMSLAVFLDPQRVASINRIGTWSAPFYWGWLPAVVVGSFFTMLLGLVLLYWD